MIETATSMAILFLLMIKWEALNNIDSGSKGVALLLMPVAARWGQVFLAYISPSAREDGFGRCVVNGLTPISLLTAFIFALLLSLLMAGWTGVAVLLAATFFSFLWARLFIIRIGGITGDIIGALSEALEVLVLLIFVMQ